ncbi:MAG TPA: hypothetical protein VK550_00575 [Polyangiaceae bacterium]|nr:hypothetical protein [Polyangiaceae bacterium]
MTPRFLVPSLVWYGLDPALVGPQLATGVKPLREWGGQLADEDAVRALLLTLDPAILLLNLGGYQVRQVVAAIPKTAVETKLSDLLSIDLSSMLIGRGTTLDWVDPAPGLVSAHAALWVEPRYPAARPAPSGVTLDMSSLAFPLEGEGVAMRFWEDGTGWLHCSWQASALTGWVDVLPAQVAELAAALEQLLADSYASIQPDADGVRVAGLLSLYHPATWSVPFASDLPLAMRAFGERVRALALPAGAQPMAEFLAAEAPTIGDDAPVVFGGLRVPSAVERLGSELLQPALDEVRNGVVASDVAFAEGVDADAVLGLTRLLMRWQEHDALDFLSAIAPSDDRYGGYDLQAGDDDTAAIYAGIARNVEAGDVLPPAGSPGFIAQLRADLAELGFGPAFRYVEAEPAAQAFSVELELAVRELQIAATSPSLAAATLVGPQIFYADGLVQVDNAWKYTGPISGVVNAETRTVISSWLERRLRCPVVIEARDRDAPFAGEHTDNLWRADQLQSKKPRVCVRDFSGMYPLEPDSVQKQRTLDLFTLGAWASSGFGDGPWALPPSHTWNEREVLPEQLVGAAFSALSDAQRSTFRAVRSVAEVECIGYFDSFNAYDRGVMSLGPCHWTIALERNDRLDETAELPAYFALLTGLGGDSAETARLVLGRFGCSIDRVWPRGTSREQAGTCWEPIQRKYVARVALAREAGNPLVLSGAEIGRAEWFRQWHWCYRFSMAARTIADYRRRMWDYARLRLRDLLATAWTPQIIILDPVVGPTPATIGDIFTSERAAGLLLRWHVNAPGDLLPIDANAKLTLAFANVGAAAWGDPISWGDAEEIALTEALYAQRPTQLDNWLRNSLDHVYNWTTSTAWNQAREGQVRSTTWESARRGYGWTLTPEMVSGAPSLNGIANVRTDVDTPITIGFSISWNDCVGAPRTPSAKSSAQAVVRDADLHVEPDGANWRIRATPVAGVAAASTRITLSVDNGAHVTTGEFSLRVGAAQADPDPTFAHTEGLSVRRRSLRLAAEDLP